MFQHIFMGDCIQSGWSYTNRRFLQIIHGYNCNLFRVPLSSNIANVVCRKTMPSLFMPTLVLRVVKIIRNPNSMPRTLNLHPPTRQTPRFEHTKRALLLGPAPALGKNNWTPRKRPH
ncbi:hypothetical protein CDAR_521771 [Caerostris darwini]|uniref:Uncharacterized protein n=1 Tax=Caerostris darwini TaxID=1538125 RepID=A0AAV4TGE8_9ARAC|nr:hypothetical protein CDAR_521771 [Caerostris darwini]